MRLWTSAKYAVDLGRHPLRTDKFKKAADRLVKAGVVRKDELAEPRPASAEMLAQAHDRDWVDRVLEGRLAAADLERLEMPCPPEAVLAQRMHVQGTVEACRDALKSGVGLHAGGGAHHAFADRGEGYCLFNDLAVAVRSLLPKLSRIAVIDLDAHQGNGTAAMLADEPRVWTFSMHREAGYPEARVPSTLDIGLPDGCGDAEYLSRLQEPLLAVLERFRPDLALYLAGADAYEGDAKGGLGLTKAGLAERDRRVLAACRERGVPVAVTLGGGYAKKPADTIEIHASTLSIAVESLMRSPTGSAKPS